MNRCLEAAAAVSAAPVVELQHAEAALDKELQQQGRPLVAHPLHPGSAVDVHDQGNRLGGPSRTSEAVVQRLAVFGGENAELGRDVFIDEGVVGVLAVDLGLGQRLPCAIASAKLNVAGALQGGCAIEEPCAALAGGQFVPAGAGEAGVPAVGQFDAVEVLLRGRLQPSADQRPFAVGGQDARDVPLSLADRLTAVVAVAVDLAGAAALRGPEVVVLADGGEVVVQVDPGGGGFLDERAPVQAIEIDQLEAQAILGAVLHLHGQFALGEGHPRQVVVRSVGIVDPARGSGGHIVEAQADGGVGFAREGVALLDHLRPLIVGLETVARLHRRNVHPR